MVIKERDSKNICSVSLYDVSEKPVLAGSKRYLFPILSVWKHFLHLSLLLDENI